MGRRHVPALLAALLLFSVVPGTLRSIVFYSTDSVTANTTTPGDNSGWQFQGRFNNFLGTPIASRYFLTANHLNQQVGTPFYFHGETFNTVASYGDPSGSDLRIFQVDHDFPIWSPLYIGNNEAGREIRVYGRGGQRGAPITHDGAVIGWLPSPSGSAQRWGRNIVTAIYADDPHYLYANFDAPGVPSEAHFTVGDSGGGGFILEDGLWKLASTNYAVDDVYTEPKASSQLVAPIFDARGYYTRIAQADLPASFVLLTGEQPVPTAFYCTRVSPSLSWIQSVTGVDPAILPTETFAGWLHGYFDADQFTDATKIGPGADPDGDRLTNLEEFAFNLDPACADIPVLAAGTGVRGLPLTRLEAVAATADTRLTVEYLRRTPSGGGGLIYTVQFANDLSPAAAGTASGWQTAGGNETVTAINTRWERVKVVDSVPANGARRFARVVVAQQAD